MGLAHPADGGIDSVAEDPETGSVDEVEREGDAAQKR
jgi:hypothetical protein